jgi:hypothetical protein
MLKNCPSMGDFAGKSGTGTGTELVSFSKVERNVELHSFFD